MLPSETFQANLLSPLTLAFVLGLIARAVRSDLTLPKEATSALAAYLLLSLGLKGGVELSHADASRIALPAAATLFLGCLTPLTAFWTLRRLGGFGWSDAAGIAAHYGSVSAVTFIAAQQFAVGMGTPPEGYLPTLLTLLECPGILVALAVGLMGAARPADANVELSFAEPSHAGQASAGTSSSERGFAEALREVLVGRTMLLLVGGLLIGFLSRESGYAPVKPFFEGNFRGALTLFLLDMGLVAGARLGDLRQVGPFLLAFGLGMPLVHGALGVACGIWAGLGTGGAAVLGAMAGSASYIAAPPAVRMTLPDANPTFYLTASLAITFPFNLLCGIPLLHALAMRLAG